MKKKLIEYIETDEFLCVCINQQEIILCSSLQFYCVALMENWKDYKQSLDAK